MRIYVIGDSISIQYGPYLEAMLAGQIGYGRKEGADEANLNLDVPVGANGGDSAMVLQFLTACREAGRELPGDAVVLNCGLHDIKMDPATRQRQVPLEAYESNLAAIATLVLDGLRRRLVWVRTTPCDERVHNARQKQFHRFSMDVLAYNAVADAVMAAHGVPSIDLHTFTLNLGGELYCDHVHFHEPVRRQQAAFIAGWLLAWTRTQRP